MDIPEEAVEAADKVFNDLFEIGQSFGPGYVREMLEAAAPYMHAEALEHAATEMDRLDALGSIPYWDMVQEQAAEYKAWAGVENERAWLHMRAAEIRPTR